MKLGNLAGLIGWDIFIVSLFAFFGKLGRQWEFGSYGLPTPMLARDGVHYRDGGDVDPLTLSLVQHDALEAFYVAGFVLVVAALGIRLAHEFWQDRQHDCWMRHEAAERQVAEGIGTERFINWIADDAHRLAREVGSTGKRL